MNNKEFDFGERLQSLMDSTEYTNPAALAKKLYEVGLVTVKSRGKDIFSKESNAISSIEKKIRRHTRSKSPDCLQGEFVMAYCKFFECAADYLFGLSDVKMPDADVRAICEKTGLDEIAVSNLIKAAPTENNYAWSRMLSSQLFEKIPQEWIAAGEQKIKAAQKQAQLEALQWEMERVGGKELLGLQEDAEGYESEMKSADAAYAGLLFSVSRNVANFIDEDILISVASVRDRFEKAYMAETKKRYKK